MRRATAIETALLQIQVQIQAEILSDRRYEYETGDDIGNHVRTMLASARPIANSNVVQMDREAARLYALYATSAPGI